MSKRVTIAAIFEEDEGPAVTPEVVTSPLSTVTTGDCLICGEKASGFHYGVFSCEGCKGFFRRSVSRGHVKACRWGNQCSMDLYTRRRCPECRLRFCKAAGMRPDCLLSQAQRRSKAMWRQLQETQSGKATPPIASANQEPPNVTPPTNQSANNPSPRLPVGGVSAAASCPQLQDVSSTETPHSTNQSAIKVENTTASSPPKETSPSNSFPAALRNKQALNAMATKAGKDMLSFLALLAHDPEILAQPIKDNITDVPHRADSTAGHDSTITAPLDSTLATPSTCSEGPSRAQGSIGSSTDTRNQNLMLLARSLEGREARASSSRTAAASCSSSAAASCSTCSSVAENDANVTSNIGRRSRGPAFVEQLTSQNLAIISEILAHKEKTMEEGCKNMLRIWQETQACHTLEEKQRVQIRHMNDGVGKVITFIKTLRGFNDLSIEDQVAVVKGSIFEYFLIKVNLIFKESGLGLKDLQGLLSTVYTQESMTTFQKWFEGIWRLNLDQVTMYLLLAVVVLSPDRAHIKDSSGLEKSQAQYIECLQAYCKVAYPDEHLMFPRLMGKLTEVRAVGLVVEKCLNADCKAMLDKQPVLPEIWSQD